MVFATKLQNFLCGLRIFVQLFFMFFIKNISFLPKKERKKINPNKAFHKNRLFFLQKWVCISPK